jgi:hypothetical protein
LFRAAPGAIILNVGMLPTMRRKRFSTENHLLGSFAVKDVQHSGFGMWGLWGRQLPGFRRGHSRL